MKEHKCSFLCELIKKSNPDLYMKHHGVTAELLIAKSSVRSLKQRAKDLKIKCRNGMTADELAKAIEIKSKGGDASKIEARARERLRAHFATYKLKPGFKKTK